jgi:hypothetical protein
VCRVDKMERSLRVQQKCMSTRTVHAPRPRDGPNALPGRLAMHPPSRGEGKVASNVGLCSHRNKCCLLQQRISHFLGPLHATHCRNHADMLRQEVDGKKPRLITIGEDARMSVRHPSMPTFSARGGGGCTPWGSFLSGGASRRIPAADA